MKKPLMISLLALALCYFLACSKIDPVAGGGTDVPNSIGGTLLDGPNRPAAKRAVALSRLALNIDPQTAEPYKSDTTDVNGVFLFQNLTAGKYVLSTPNSSGNLSLPRTVVDLKMDSAVQLNSLALKSKVTLSGSILIPDALSTETLNILVTGMELPIEMSEAAHFTISEVPVGPLEIVFLLGHLVNTLKLEMDNNAGGTLVLAPLEFVFFDSKSQGSNLDYLEEREESYQIVPLELNPESPIQYLVAHENGEDVPVTQIEEKPGASYIGEIVTVETAFQVQVEQEIMFPLDHIELGFNPENGQQVVILVVEETVTEVKLLSEHGLVPANSPEE